MPLGSTNRPQRIAVIGTGILGACVGWNLSRQGAQVIFIDAAQPGEGVTDWTFSWVNASNKTVTKPYFDLNVAGMAEYRSLAEAIGPDAWWHPTGHLRWVEDPAARAKLTELVELLAGWGYRVEGTTAAEVRQRLEPALALPDDALVVVYPDEAWVNGRRLVGRLVEQAVAAGAERRFGVAVREAGTGSDGGVRAVALSDGSSLAVDAIVNAAGPQASHVAGLVARELPMRREPGAVARLRCGRVPISRAMHAPHIEMRPDGDDVMVLHSREIDALIDASAGAAAALDAGAALDTGAELDAGAGSAPTEADLGRLLHESARRVIPGLGEAHVTQTRVSNRPIPDDGFPSVGALPSVPGYYEAVSHSGITLGPVLGRLLASEIRTGERDELLAGFRPERFTL